MTHSTTIAENRRIDVWTFPGGASLKLYVSLGHRASLTLKNQRGDTVLYLEYDYFQLDKAQQHAEAVVELAESIEDAGRIAA